MAKAEAQAIDNFTTKYTLPGGPVLFVRRAKNAVRRMLVEAPDERMNNVLETVAAACIAKMEIPAGYCEDKPEGATQEWKADEKNPFSRYDDLDFLDQQAFFAAWQDLNLPTKSMVEGILAEIKKAKAPGKA